MSKQYEMLLQEQINKLERECAQLRGLTKALLNNLREVNERIEDLDNRIPVKIDDEIPVLLSIRDFSKKHSFMSENSIRWMLFKELPGLEECLVRVSTRIFIDEKKFFSFLQSKNKELDE